ncbi:MAG: hypothetical protein NTW87_31655 [Planctomycetota bacterium]|nr:hypothetical protein [Planctomycetota bacterium]
MRWFPLGHPPTVQPTAVLQKTLEAAKAPPDLQKEWLAQAEFLYKALLDAKAGEPVDRVIGYSGFKFQVTGYTFQVSSPKFQVQTVPGKAGGRWVVIGRSAEVETALAVHRSGTTASASSRRARTMRSCPSAVGQKSMPAHPCRAPFLTTESIPMAS